MYWAFAAVVASVVSCNAPLPAGAVASTTKFTAPPGRVSAVLQPCVLVGVTTIGAAASAVPANATASKPAPPRLIFNRLNMDPPSGVPHRHFRRVQRDDGQMPTARSPVVRPGAHNSIDVGRVPARRLDYQTELLRTALEPPKSVRQRTTVTRSLAARR